MSNMPPKKRSCFQITSVIQAQVAGNCITDDAESNDDPDESRTEDVSSETVDVCRTDLGVCDRSSSEEAVETQLHTVDGHNGSVPVNGLLSVKGTGGRNTPLNFGGSVPVPAANQPIVPASTSQPSSVSSSGASTSCSRFRVIKLDHGTGEPFKRGRWACTEFYEKDSDTNRTADSMKPPVIHDHSIDRDSGLGAIGNSVAAPRAFPAQPVDNADKSGSPKGHHMPLPSSEPPQQAYTLAAQIGSVASAFQPTGYATAKTQQAHDVVQPVISQNFIPNSLNGVHQGAMMQKSTVMPSATQSQQFAYSNGMSPGRSKPDYHPQHLGSSALSYPATSQPLMTLSSQQPVSIATGPGGQGLQAQGSEAVLTSGLHPETVSDQAVTPVSRTLGRMSITASSPLTITSHSGVQSVPATVPSISSIPDHPSASGSQIQETRPKLDALPLSITSVVPGKATVKPLITEGLLHTPAVSLFGITIPVDGDDDSVSGASVVAIDNKIEQAMDLVKNHLMYAVREEVEVLKEQIKELYERNSVLERENAVLKSLANSEQLNKLSTQLKHVNNVASPQLHQQQSASSNNSNALGHYEVVKSAPRQPNITTA